MTLISAQAPPTYRRVVVPLDGSPFSEKALSVARELAALFGATIHLAGFGLEPSHEDELRARLLSIADEQGGGPVWTGLTWDVVEGITDVAAGDEPALVCMASHARHGLSGVVLGSMASELLVSRDEPVIVVGPAFERGAGIAGGPVVVAVDGTPGSEDAVGLGVAWAGRLGTTTEIVTVAEPVPEPPFGHHTHRHHGPGDDPAGYVERLAARWRAPGSEVTAAVIYDPVSVSDAFTDYLAGRPAGLAVLATRPRHGATRAVFGSTADAIIRHSTVPVLLTRRREDG